REVLVRDAQLLAQQLDRITRLAQLPRLVAVAIDLWIADVVAREPDRLEVDEDGPAPAARVVESLARRAVDDLDVLPVGLQRLHPEGFRALREVADRGVLRLGRRLGPLVVLEHEHRGHLPELREVERLVEGADVRRAVAEE